MKNLRDEVYLIPEYHFKADENPPVLDYFFLKTDVIGQGYGRKLWDHCVEQARKKGWKEFTFWADPPFLRLL